MDLAKGGELRITWALSSAGCGAARGKWFGLCYRPSVKKRTELLRTLKAIFRSYRSQPVDRVVDLINPDPAGMGELLCPRPRESPLLVRSRLGGEEDPAASDARNSKRQGFGWKRWSRRWLYEHLGLFNNYRVQPSRPHRKRSQPDRSHNPWCEACRRAGCGKIRTHGFDGRGLETEPKGHRASPRPYL